MGRWLVGCLGGWLVEWLVIGGWWCGWERKGRKGEGVVGKGRRLLPFLVGWLGGRDAGRGGWRLEGNAGWLFGWLVGWLVVRLTV